MTGKNKEGQILDADTGEQVTTFFADGPYIGFPTFSRDGRLAARCVSNLIVWNAESGEQVRTFRVQAGVMGLAFSPDPDGTLLASGGWDGCIRVWDTIHDAETIPIAGAPPKGYFARLSPDCRIVATGFLEGTIHLWNAATGEPRGEPLQVGNKAITTDWTADGKRLLLTDVNRNVTVWDTDTCKKLREFKHDSPLREFQTHLRFQTHLSPDGKWFACKGLGGELKVWDVEKGLEFHSFAGLAESPSILFCPDSARLAAVDTSGVVKLWDIAASQELWSVKTGINGVGEAALTFSPDGKRLAVRGFTSDSEASSEVHILEVLSGHEISPPLKGITGDLLIFSPDGNRLITITQDSILKVWDIASGQQTLTLKGNQRMVTDLAFSPDGHRLISVSADMSVRIWDATPSPE